MTCIKYQISLLFLVFTFCSFGQINEGHIVFERRTNLEKRFEGVENLEKLINQRNKYRLEEFHLYFNDTISMFILGEFDTDDPLSWTTNSNTVLRNTLTRELSTMLDLNGSVLIVSDSIRTPIWKITDETRSIGNYSCQKAFYDRGDSVRIYAWYTTDIAPSIGPESLGGLPGTILGLATEDGGVVYFSKSVEVGPQKLELFKFDARKPLIITMDELKKELQKSNADVTNYILEDLYRWI